MRRISGSKRWKLVSGVAFALLAVAWLGNGAFAQDAGGGSTGVDPEYDSTGEAYTGEAAGSDAGSGTTTTGYDAGGYIDPESGFYVYPHVFDAGEGALDPLDAGVDFGDAGVDLGDGGPEITQSTRLRPRTVVE